MIKITFPDMTKEEAIELVESRYGVMYWNPEKGKTSAYPFDVNNPVVIEQPIPFNANPAYPSETS